MKANFRKIRFLMIGAIFFFFPLVHAGTAGVPCEAVTPPNPDIEELYFDVTNATQGKQLSLKNLASSCPGLPEIKDPKSFEDLHIQELLKTPFTDNLMQASCGKTPEGFSSSVNESCPPFKRDIERGKSYQISGGLISSDARFVADSIDETMKIDKRVSDLATESHEKVRGLCDFVTLSDYALDSVSKCLKMPNMIGVGELQLNAPGFGGGYNDPNFLLSKKGPGYSRLVAILNLLKENKGEVIEIHFNNSQTGPVAEETTALLELTSQYPTIKFVSLHSGIGQVIGTQGLRAIGKFYQSHPSAPKNIWTDNSGAADLLGEMNTTGLRGCDTLKMQAELATSWRAFGLERVVFGSDDGFGPDGYNDSKTVMRARIGLLANPFLTADEKLNILSKNFNSLISR